jgi:hypothetical protein
LMTIKLCAEFFNREPVSCLLKKAPPGRQMFSVGNLNH